MITIHPKVKGEILSELDSETLEVVITCPYCKNKHAHGISKTSTKNIRMGECAQGAYEIILNKE